ncbi:Transposase [Nitrosospira multiformis]|uniref:Transposase n=1 Tax=Nitrosospira multiformis TaxID=1231 RepID=A0A1H8C1V2_9PROT|nr:transposase [Nitrosospira multiformis]SEM89181.1 Transposase [Nitrosospira multiformis]
MAAVRLVWRDSQKTCDPPRLIFLDETGASTDMTRRHGDCLVGERCHDHVPGGPWKTMTFVATLHLDGLVAPWCLDAPRNGAAFLAYGKTQLCPALKPGDIVVCDNVGSHKVAGVREMIEDKGARIYLPPYSPDLNPMKQVFSKIKTLLGKAAERFFDALWVAMGRTIETIRPQEYRNYFANSGYVSN